MMLIILAALAILSAIYVFNRYYLKPKKEIQNYIKTFRSLGYVVYELPFVFFGASYSPMFEKGLKEHKDTLYIPRTVYPDIDIAVGNILDKSLIALANP